MADFYAKIGHTGPSLRATLINPDGTTPVLLNCTVRLLIERVNRSLYRDLESVIIDPNEAIVQRNWQAADLQHAGLFLFGFVVYPNAGGSIPYPTDKNWVLQVDGKR